MATKTLSAGDIIDARCTRCRDILNHRIVAMVGGKVVRVECNTCGGVHNYYPPPSSKPAKTTGGSVISSRPAATASRAPKKEPQQSDCDEWRMLRPNMSLDRAVAYDMNTKYRVNALIDHPTFGYGVVKAVLAPNKMQVLFEDGVKLLRCK